MVYGANPIEVDADYDVAIELNGTVADGIRPVLQQLNQQATVYDMAGRVVCHSVTLSDVKRLPAGVYIFSGVKIRVK